VRGNNDTKAKLISGCILTVVEGRNFHLVADPSVEGLNFHFSAAPVFKGVVFTCWPSYLGCWVEFLLAPSSSLLLVELYCTRFSHREAKLIA